jgi:hypothetical protein
MQDWRGVGQSARLDHDAIERRSSTFVKPLQQALKGLRQVGANFATQTTSREFDDTVFARFDEFMVEPDLAELIDDDGGA